MEKAGKAKKLEEKAHLYIGGPLEMLGEGNKLLADIKATMDNTLKAV